MRPTYRNFLSVLIMVFFFGFRFPVWAQEEISQPQPDSQAKADDSKKDADKKADLSSDSKENASKEETPVADIDSIISVWGTHKTEDSSKAEEYGEVPHGFLLQYLKAAINMQSGRHFNITAANAGLNDGQYSFNYGMAGSYNVYVDYSKIPHLFSKDGETIFEQDNDAQWRLADSVQSAVQNLNPVPTTDPTYQAGLAAQRSFISSLLLEAHPQSLGLQRNRGTAGVDYDINSNWKVNAEYFQENRDGFRPLGTSLGFSWVLELPETINYHTYRARTGVEYSNSSTTFSAAYEYLDFKNENQAFIWDNPFRITDRAEQTAGDGTSQGQLQLPASNHSNMFSLTGATTVGAGRVSGVFSLDQISDSVNMLPYTINSALEQVALPGPTFTGSFRNINADVRYYLPVTNHGNLTVNYRLFDQHNGNNQFLFSAFAPYDNSIDTVDATTNDLVAYKTNTLDFDFNWALAHGLRALTGYSYTRFDRQDREVDKTGINTVRLGLDAFGTDRLTLHARWQYDHRKSDTFNLDNPTYDVIPLRRFDTANLNRNSFRVMADYVLTDAASLEGTVSYQKNDFPDTQYGLLSAKYWTIGGDFSYAVTDKSTLDAWYEHANNISDQLGRQSSVTPSLTTDFDWTANISDHFDTIGLGYLEKFQEGNMSLDTSFIYARANGFVDLFGGAAVRPTGAQSLPNADDTNHTEFKAQFSVKTFKHANIMIGYWFDKYTINDFSEDAVQTDLITVVVPGPTGPTISTPGVILLNARQGNYTYNTGWIGIVYNW